MGKGQEKNKILATPTGYFELTNNQIHIKQLVEENNFKDL